MQVLKQSTTATILVGPVLDADGAAYTSAVIGDFNITKNGSTAALAAAATATHSHNGMYLVALTTGNTDTLGRLDVSMNNTSYGMTNHRYEVLSANQFDALVTNGSVTPAAIADAVLEESILDHRNVAHSLARYIYQIKQATLTIDGVVSNAITPTTLTFSSNISATTSAYAHAVLLFVSGPLTGENSPIISYNNTNGVFVLEEPLTAAPSDGDEFVVIAGSHVHAIADIAAAIDITVAPLQATAPNRVAGTEVVTYINDTSAIGPIVVTDGDGDAVDLSSYTLKICIERKENGTIDDNITPTISGAGNNQVTFTPTAACVNSTTPRKWSLRRTSNGQVFAFGDFKVEWPARLS